MSLADLTGFLVFLGFPALLVVVYVGFWVFLRRIPLWSLEAGVGLSLASILLAWALAPGSTAEAEVGRSDYEFYGPLISGIIGLLCVLVLTLVTGIIELVRSHRRQEEDAELAARHAAPLR
jgi:hypothetical protein